MATKNIQTGDRVRFLNETGGGRVTRLLNKDMVSVETQDGFEIPTYIKNLVVIEPDLPPTNQRGVYSSSSSKGDSTKQFTEVKKGETFKETNQVKNNDIPEFIFAALPENPFNPTEGKIRLYLVNDCNHTLIYHFATKISSQYTTIDAGMLEPNTKVELDTIQPKSMGELPEYCFQLLFFRKQSSQLEEPVQKEVKISPVKFFKASSFVRTSYFSEPALLIRLVDHPLKAVLDKLTDKDFQQVTISKENKKSANSNVQKPELIEVDLHINQLLDNTSGLSNADMLKLQLDTFRKEMDKAIASGTKKIVFIHGVGDGVLKNELRRELGRKYSRYPFQDASFREYGFGATMAILKK